MIMEPTSRDKIERRVVMQEPIPSNSAIGPSIIVVTQIKLRSWSAYQGGALMIERHRRNRLENCPLLHHVPSPTDKAIRRLPAIQCRVVQSEGRQRAHWTHSRLCAE
jgi:hypothetical protein